MQVTLDQELGRPRLRLSTGEFLPPLAFRSFRPNAENVGAFAQLGTRIVALQVSGNICSLDVPYNLYGGCWTGPGQSDFAALHRQMADLREWSDQAYILVLIDLNPPDWWLAAHPGHPDPFTSIGQVAGSKAWRAEAADYLRALLHECEAHYGEHVLGYALMGGRTHEWFALGDDGDCAVKLASWQAWRGTTEPLPSPLERLETFADGRFRDPLSQAAVCDYWRWYHETVGDLVLHFAATAQGVLGHRKLVGSFYGYILEFEGQRLLEGGHLALDQVFRSPDLDFFLCPSSYQHRHPDAVSAFMMPIDTLRRHGKFIFLEFDHITYTAVTHVEGHGIPGHRHVLPDDPTACGVMGRDFLMSTCRGQGQWWFDMFGNWFGTPAMQDLARRAQQTAAALLDLPYRPVADLAVIVDPWAMIHHTSRNQQGRALLNSQLDGLGRAGAAFAIHSLADLFDDGFDLRRFKLVALLNAFRDLAELHPIVARIQAAGGTVLWFDAPGYVGAEGLGTSSMKALTGLEFARLDRLDALQSGPESIPLPVPLEPAFAVPARDGDEVLAWAGDGLAGMLRRPVGPGYAAFSALAPLSGRLWRHFAESAGCHLYAHDDAPVYLTADLLGVYSAPGGERTLTLPSLERLELLFSSRETSEPELLQTDPSGRIVLRLSPTEARLYRRHRPDT